MFGYSNEDLKKLGATYTATEIYQQPAMWEKTLGLIEGKKTEIKAFLKQHIDAHTRVVFTGAGTSAYTGNIAYTAIANLLPCRVESIPSTDIVSNPELWVEPDTKTILVSFARSGNSPESVGAFDIFEQCVKDVTHLVITCAADGHLALCAQKDSRNFVVLLPEETNDKGFAMTSSFSCMLLASLLFFDIDALEQNVAHVAALAQQGRRILENDWQAVKSLAEGLPERIVYLGTGCLHELGRELSLKNMELTNGKIVSINESVLGFRHGPKTIINDKTLLLLLGSENKHTARYTRDLARELHNDPGNYHLAVIAYNPDAVLQENCDSFICVNGGAMPEKFASLCYALYGQLMGLFNSITLGNTPDNPNPAGLVNRVVKGVTIYPYPEN